MPFAVDTREVLELDRRLARVGKILNKTTLGQMYRIALKPAVAVLKANAPVGKKRFRSTATRRTRTGKIKRDGTYDRGGATKRDARLLIGNGRNDETIVGLVGISKKSGRSGWRTHFIEEGTKPRATRRGANRGVSPKNNFVARTARQVIAPTVQALGDAADVLVQKEMNRR